MRPNAVTLKLIGAGAAIALTAAACGGKPAPTVASLGGSTTTTTLSVAPGGGSGQPDPIGFTHCMRAHGVTNFPDPVVTGHSVTLRITPAIAGNPHFVSAQQACAHFLPKLAKGGGSPQTITAAEQQDYLRAAACMRSHGFPQFPDPTFANGGVHFTLPPGMNQNSPGVQQAITTCQKLIPSGLPYSAGS